jgi:hypothetical protein
MHRNGDESVDIYFGPKALSGLLGRRLLSSSVMALRRKHDELYANDFVLVRDRLIGLRKHRPITQQQDHHWDVVDLLCQWCSSNNLGSARPRPSMSQESIEIRDPMVFVSQRSAAPRPYFSAITLSR